MQEVKLTGTLREDIGTKSAKATRKEGLIPCVLYGGKNGNIHFTLHPNDVKHIVFTREFKTASIDIDGKEYRCIVKDLQFHPVTDAIHHIDFLALHEGVKIKTQIPLRCVGTAPGTKEGGKMIQKIRAVDIKTTPQHLVDELTVSVADLAIGVTKRIRDIDVPENIQILNAPNIPVASIEIPRILKSAAAAAASDEDTDEEEGEDESNEEGTE